MNKMLTMLKRLAQEEAGQDLIEYALLAAFISLASVIAMTALGGAISDKYNAVKTTLDTAS